MNSRIPHLPAGRHMQRKPLLMLVLLGCGGGASIDPSPTTVIAKTSGDAQEAVVGQPLASPIQVLVTEDNTPVAGAIVTWTNGLGDAFIPDSTPTDAEGLASTHWTLGPDRGVHHATATVTGSTSAEVEFTATAIHDVPAVIEKFGGDNQSGTVNTQLRQVQVYVTDRFGNFVAGVEVGWSASGGTLASPTVTTNFTGISSQLVTLGNTPGPVTITASADGLTGSPLTFTATAKPVPPPAEPLMTGRIIVR